MTTWHLDPTLVGSYADGSLDDPRAFSIEAHLPGCAACRSLVADAFDTGRTAALWDAVAGALDAPVPGPVERVLVRVGIAEHLARLLVATPVLGAAWIVAVVVALGFAVVAARLMGTEQSLLVFLGVAPLVPVAGIAVAYGPGVDPTHELGIATPMHGLHLLALRAVAVLAVSTAIAGVGALLLPSVGWLAAAWLLPALGGTLATLALSTFLDLRWAAGSVGWTWLAIVGVTARTSSTPLSLFDLPLQVAALGVACTALLVVLGRRDTFDTVR